MGGEESRAASEQPEGGESRIGATSPEQPEGGERRIGASTSEQPEDRRIVLLGKNGAGKSSIANTILGEDVFNICHSANPGTIQCTGETRSVNGKNITLIDTPGFFDTNRSKKKLRDEVVNCITECTPGPHAFLILLKVDRFTKQEKKVIKEIQNTFSKEAFKYAAVVFTHGDQLPEGMKIEAFVQKNKDLNDLVEKCGGRCHVIDNKYWNQQDEYRSNQFQVEKLLSTIDKMVEENNGGCYTNEMLQTVERMIKEYGKIHVSNFLKMSVGITTGILLGALLGVTAMISLVVGALKKMKSPTAAVTVAEVAVGAAGAAGLGIAVGAAAGVGAIVGGCIGLCEAENANSVGEAAKNTVNAVLDKSLQTFKTLQISKSEDEDTFLTEDKV